MKYVYVMLVLILPLLSSAQPFIYNANFANVKFGGPGVTIVYKVGSGTTAGSIVLYQNVVNIGGQQIDAIVRLKTLSANTSMIFDQAGTGTGYTNNNPTWFSPQFLFPAGGGSALFDFEFIVGGTYDNTTNTGTSATLQNIMVNSYDIDGNDAINSKQYSEFGGFFTSEMATATSVVTTYNAATNLTRFTSTIDNNIVNASDPNTRIRVTYNEVSDFEISVGSQGEGVAYFFIDFDAGPIFGVPTKTTTAPPLDLNTTTPGFDNTATFCSSPVFFTAGGANIRSVSSTPSGGTTLERIKVSFPTTDIKNGGSERFLINGASNGGTIQLNFIDNASISNIVLSGTPYRVIADVTNGESSLLISRNGGSGLLTIAEGEKLLDALSYNNTAATPTTGTRNFEVTVKDGAYESQPSKFTVTVGSVPSITSQPSSSLIPTGSNTSFQVTSNATSYQWQVDPNTGVFSNVTNTGVYSGATTNKLTLTNVPYSMNNYKYRVIASSATCPATSSSATLSVLIILPVKWLSFTGSAQGKGIILNWGTSNEINAKNFVIQFSSNGRDFSDIGTIDAATTSGNHYYSFTHNQPAEGNNYYRILQVDADGQHAYSKLIVVSYGADESFRILSNPVVGGKLAIQTNKSSEGYLFSADGRLVKKLQLASGTNYVDVSGMSKGIYSVRCGTEARKILLNN